MKLLIFTEGTILTHKSANGLKRKDIIEQVIDKDKYVKDYASYIPIGNAVKKLKTWKEQGLDILYLTSRIKLGEIRDIKRVLKKYNFPKGKLLYRKGKEKYKDVAERIIPDVLIEDNCESIGGNKEMTIIHVNPKIKKMIKYLIVKEFGGIDRLPNKIAK